MRVDSMFTLWNYGNRRPYTEVVGELRDEVALAEEAGFTTAWIGEHHFQGEGFDVLPNPIVLGTDLAARTSKIRLGLGAIGLPAWNPVRLAEDLAMLDNLSGGRLDCAFGRGILPRDIMTFNPEASRDDPARSVAIFLEYLDIVRQAWTDEAFTYKGHFLSYPPSNLKNTATAWYPRDERWVDEDGIQIALPVVPWPQQKPHPPLFTVSEKQEGFAMAAEQGLRPVTWLPCGEILNDTLDAYRAQMELVDGRKLRRGEECGLMRPCFVAETDEEARRATIDAYDRMGRNMGSVRGRIVFADKGEEITESDEALEWFDFLLERDQIIVGTPDKVVETIKRLESQHGLDYFWLWMNTWGISHDDTMRSLKLFGDEVMPSLQS